MKISTRDLQVIAFVARFGQVLEDHVRRTVFKDNQSLTPCNRTMNRLVEQKLLARIQIPAIGNANGGRRPYVYQVGPAGWKLANTEGAYWQARSVNYHSLAIADVYVSLLEKLDIVRVETEPDNHVKINYVPLQPDLYVEVNLGRPKPRKVWLECDLGTERPKQLKDKMSRYFQAWDGAPTAWDPFPYVWFVVPDSRRSDEIKSLVALQPAEARPMFRVSTFETIVHDISS